MKLLLVAPRFSEKGLKNKGMPMASPAIEYLAGLTVQQRPDIEIQLIDAKKEEFDPDRVEADLTGFTVLTPQAPWVYRMADKLRARGKKVVLGGIHVTALPQEAGRHADAIVLGEAESVWKTVLDDAERGSLNPVYNGGFANLSGLPHPVTNLWNTKYVFGYFQTSRGCQNRCTFCSVHKFFGGKVRLRPIPDVIAELAAGTKRLYWGIDDNIWGVDIERSIELYREMSVSLRGKWWFGTGDLLAVQQPRADELLKYARRSGLTSVMLGWESNNQASLEEYKAATKQGRARRDAIKRIRDYGIDVVLFMIIGGRQDTREDFEGIIKLSDELKVSVHPSLTMPFPGTDLYKEYQPYLFEGLEWDSLDGNHAVFHHPTLSPQEREEAFTKLRLDLYTLPRIIRNVTQISMKGFPMSHITSWMLQYSPGKAFRDYAQWRERTSAGGELR